LVWRNLAVALLVLASLAVLLVISRSLIGLPPYTEACICIGSAPPKTAYNGRWYVAILEPEDVNESVLNSMKKASSTLLAYLNFGYAEEWRDYWNEVEESGIVHGESPEYEGEYFVEYWSDEWINITAALAISYLEEGFDGVLLDNIDACEAVAGMPWAPSNPCQLMASSVAEVVEKVRSEYPGAKIYVNIGTAVHLLANSSFLNVVDGVLREEVWYRWSSPCTSREVNESLTDEALHYLELAKARGKDVIVADFVENVVETNQVCWEAWSRGFIPVPQPACDHDYTAPPSYGGCVIQPLMNPVHALGST